MNSTALLLNLFDVAIAFIHYAKEGYFNKKLIMSYQL